MSQSDAPAKVALEQALALVEGIPDGALYLVGKEGWPVAFEKGQALPGFHQGQFLDLDAPAPPPYGHGIAALTDLIRKVWGVEQGGSIATEPLSFWYSSLPDAHEYLCRLAVPLPVAHRLWGWGKVVASAPARATDVAGNAAKSTGTGHEWVIAAGYNAEWLLGECNRFMGLYGKRGHYMKKLIADLEAKGVVIPGKDKAREIRRVVDDCENSKAKTNPAGPFDGLGVAKKFGKR